jgi:hypothetical protein
MNGSATDQPAKLFPCPCCGSIYFSESPGSYEICEVCGWEDDIVQLADPLFAGGANEPSLYEAQQAFIASGVRAVNPEPAWRPFEPALDNVPPIELRPRYAETPDDRTTLYYWRDSYWLRARD